MRSFFFEVFNGNCWASIFRFIVFCISEAYFAKTWECRRFIGDASFFMPFFVVQHLFLLINRYNGSVLSQYPSLTPHHVTRRPPCLHTFPAMVQRLRGYLLFFRVHRFVTFRTFRRSNCIIYDLVMDVPQGFGQDVAYFFLLEE